MALIFKIFLLLFLQQGGKVAKDINVTGKDGTNLESVFPGRPMVLQVQADEMLVNELVSMIQASSVEVKKENLPEGIVIVQVHFKNLAYGEGTKMMERMQPLLIRGVRFQWMDQIYK
jgi:hypothetical protein